MKVLVTSAAFGQPAMQENIKYLNSVADSVVMKPSQKPLTAKEMQHVGMALTELLQEWNRIQKKY